VNTIRKNLGSLQAFRGIAALSVLLYHIDGRYRADTKGEVVQPVFSERFLGGHMEAGHLGVDFFFVLSGFIIYWIHEKDLGKPEAGRYYLLKRLARIYPVLLGALVLKFVLVMFAGSLWMKGDLQMDALLSTLFLLPAKPTFVGGAWTLVHEMLFYMVFLFGVILGRKVFWAFFIAWVLLILGLDFTGHYQRFEGALSFIFHPNNLQFFIGVLIALVARNYSNKLWQTSLIIPAFILICSASSIHFLTDQWQYQFLSIKTLFWGSAFGLLLWGVVALDQSTSFVWPKFMRVLGDASYTIYLFHLIFVAVFKTILHKVSILHDYPHVMMGSNAVLTLASCLIVWRLFEKNVLDWCNSKIAR
jgi:peptidoglycan/LPS O-acetylase OafA/YrhL